MKTRSIIRGVVTIVATFVVTAFLYYGFLTTPVLSFWSMREWQVVPAIGALLMGAFFRLWHRRLLVFILSAAAGLIGGAISAEVQFGQRDTAEYSSWLFMIQNGLSRMLLYKISGLLTLVIGWYVADGVARSHATHRKPETSS